MLLFDFYSVLEANTITHTPNVWWVPADDEMKSAQNTLCFLANSVRTYVSCISLCDCTKNYHTEAFKRYVCTVLCIWKVSPSCPWPVLSNGLIFPFTHNFAKLILSRSPSIGIKCKLNSDEWERERIFTISLLSLSLFLFLGMHTIDRLEVNIPWSLFIAVNAE